MLSADLVIANIVYQQDEPTQIHLERFVKNTVDNKKCTGIAGYAEVSSNDVVSLSEGSVHEDAELRKAYSKGLKATLRVQQLLAGTSDKNSENQRSATMNIDETSIVGGPPADCHARDILGITSFEKVDFEFPGSSGVTSNTSSMAPSWAPPVESRMGSTQYLHFSCPSLKIEDAIIDRNGQPRYDSISVVSGNCLFSNNIIGACDREDGTLDLTPLSYSKPTVYEIEYIARAAPAIADLACTILSRNQSVGVATPVSINLDVPNWHYYRAVDQKLQNGLCTAQDALLYLAGVERRYDQVSSVFETAIRHECSLRGQPNPVINISSRYNVVTDCIKSALSSGKQPDFDLVMQRLDEQEDGVWRQFFELIPAKEHPKDFQALGHLFYVFQVMKAAFQKQVIPQTPDFDFEPSLQLAAPEEMSLCLPTPMTCNEMSREDMNEFLLSASRCEFGPAWSQYQFHGLDDIAADGDDNELSFDASSTVDIRLVSSDVWASTADATSSGFEDDMQPETVTVVEDETSTPSTPLGEMFACRSPRLLGQDTLQLSTASKIYHLPPASDSFISAACMLGAQDKITAVPASETVGSHDAMVSAFEAASSFCIGVAGAGSEPSSDDELASHGFMLPSPVLSRSYWASSVRPAESGQAAPILTDDNTSHAAMLVTYAGSAARQFQMDVGITEDDGAALDDIASFAAMVSISIRQGTISTANDETKRTEQASKDEVLSCAAMAPTSESASTVCMAEAGWDMKDSDAIDVAAAHAIMANLDGRTSGLETDMPQPAGKDELDSCAAMLPESEAASSACMLAQEREHTANISDHDGQADSHAAMLGAFAEPEPLGMARQMCLAAAMTPIEPATFDQPCNCCADESAAHVAMLGSAGTSSNDDSVTESANTTSDDSIVSHFAMLPDLDHESSAAMVPREVHDGLHAMSAMMPADEHVSHTAMLGILDDESSSCMASTLSPSPKVGDEMPAASADLELASHSAMRGIIDLSSSFCMSETLAYIRELNEDEDAVLAKEEADTNVVMLPSLNDDEASNITMLFPAAEEAESHAAMTFRSDAAGIMEMQEDEQASHVAMLPQSVGLFYLGKPAKLPVIMEDTVDSHASHAVMVTTSNDELVSHEIMLPTSADESASHQAMRPTSNDEGVSHVSMLPAIAEEPSTADSGAATNSHDAMMTSSICMAATLKKTLTITPPQSSTTSTRTTSRQSSASSTASSNSSFVKLPKTKKGGKAAAEEIKKPQVLILSVDSNCERKIYSRSQKLLKKLRASPDAPTYPTLVEAYLMNRVFINGNAQGSNLYLDDPSPERPVGGDGLEMEPVEIVRKLYGDASARNLEGWFRDVGLGL